MEGTVTALVTMTEITLLDTALRQLAVDLGDDYKSDQAMLAAALCGPDVGCFALLASRAGRPVGAVLAAPVFSTSRGGTGLFVSDLWVAQDVRGKGLARQLLARTLQEGAHRNAGHFLKLSVYHDNPGAIAAYGRLGLTVSAAEINMVLMGASLKILKETA